MSSGEKRKECLIPLSEVPLDGGDSLIQAREGLERSGREVEVILATRRAAVPDNSLNLSAVGGVGDGTDK